MNSIKQSKDQSSNHLAAAISQLPDIRAKERPALMTHVVVGYPSLEESFDIIKVMAEMGVWAAELQFPFSDPMADGPTIMWANEESLRGGTRVADCFRLLKQLSTETSMPIVPMTYFNLLAAAKQGPAGFCKKVAAAGGEAIIVPDVPFDDKIEHFPRTAKEAGISAIPLVSPVTGEERMRLLSSLTDAEFVYCVSTTGTTGARSNLPPGLPAYLKTVRRNFNRPLALGFGISAPEHVKALSGLAEIAIVGSATIDVIKSTRKQSRLSAMRGFLRKLLG